MPIWCARFDPMEVLLLDRKSTRLNSQSHLNLVCRLLLEKRHVTSGNRTHRDLIATRGLPCGENRWRETWERTLSLTNLFFKRQGIPEVPPFFPTRPLPD